tara:strand:- start:80551 stop:80787 length:237 start_codon:yes stop_codon:yes gene_type:complete
MDGSLGHFKATLARRKERQEKNRSRFDDGKNSSAKSFKTEYDIPKVSEKELEKVKLTFKVKRESQLINEAVIVDIVII